MIPQVYNMDRQGGEVGRVFLQDAISKFRPGVADQMSETFKSALEYNSLAFAGDLLRSATDTSTEITKDMWNYEDHENYRKGIPFREGLTEDQAYVEAERYDRDQVRSQFMHNTNPWDLHNLGAAFASAIFDPLSYVPMVGLGSKAIGIGSLIAKRMGTVANVASKMHPLKSIAINTLKPIKPIAVYGAEGALGESAFQILRATATESNGKDFDYMGAMLDVSIATVFGSTLGTIPVARTIKKNFTEKQQLIAIAKATHDFKQHGEVQLDGASPLGEGKPSKVETEINYKEEMDELRTSQEHKLNKDLHPIVEHLNSLGEDLTAGVNNLINRFRDCK
jgi:hypothetical protein